MQNEKEIKALTKLYREKLIDIIQDKVLKQFSDYLLYENEAGLDVIEAINITTELDCIFKGIKRNI